jgi:hypothetical protein
MVISEKHGIWRITNLILEHNHPLEPGGRFFRSHGYMTKEEKAIIRTMKQCNIPTRNIILVLAHMRGVMTHKYRGCIVVLSINKSVKPNEE